MKEYQAREGVVSTAGLVVLVESTRIAIHTSLWTGFFLIIAMWLLVPARVLGQSDLPNDFPRIDFHGSARFRVETWTNFDFVDAPGRDDTFMLGRLFLGSDIWISSRVRAFVEAKTAMVSDRGLPGGTRPIDSDHLDLQNAYLDVVVPFTSKTTLTARGGRQELLFGHQRLVSPLDWANARRTFDGARAILVSNDWEVHGFWARPVLVKENEFNPSDDDADFYGIYASRIVEPKGYSFDLYWMGLDRESSTFNGTSGRERRQTFGGRIGGIVSKTGWEYDLEAALQIGKVGEGKISALMVGSWLAYAFEEARWAPILKFGFDYGSGDDTEGGDVGTFNQLFPLGHAYLGHVDAVGRQNVVAINGGLGFRPIRSVVVTATGHRFWLASENDALYNAGGAVSRRPVEGNSKSVGSELDLTASWQLAPEWVTLLGYGRFFAGPFLEDTGPSEDTWFWYLSLEWRT